NSLDSRCVLVPRKKLGRSLVGTMSSTQPSGGVYAAPTNQLQLKHVPGGGMHIRNELIPLLLAAAFAQIACSSQFDGDTEDVGLDAHDTAIRTLPACPRVAVDTTGWTSDSTRDGRLMLRLPPERSELSATSQIWVFSFGELG